MNKLGTQQPWQKTQNWILLYKRCRHFETDYLLAIIEQLHPYSAFGLATILLSSRITDSKPHP
jgi:hypothetical protein